jgi:hypothetical protein
MKKFNHTTQYRCSISKLQSSAPHILSVVLHHDGIALATIKVGDKTNEIPVAQQVLEELPLDRSIVTLDALHTQKETARIIVTKKRSDYLMTVKDNQEELLEKIQRLPEEAFSPSVYRSIQSTRKSRDSLNSSSSDRQTELFPIRKAGMLARKKIGHLKSKRSATHSQKDRPPCGKVPGCPSNHILGGVNGQKKEPTGRSAPDGEGAKRTAAV